MKGGGGVVVLLTGRWLAREGHIQSAGSPVRRTGAQQQNEQGLEHNLALLTVGGYIYTTGQTELDAGAQ